MTDTPDTSLEAAERFADMLERDARRQEILPPEMTGLSDDDEREIAATLRALAAERDALRDQVRHASWAGEAYALVEARAEAAETKLEAALERLDASLFTNAEHQQAKDILRAVKRGGA